MTTATVVLASRQARPVRAGHPAVYDGSVERVEGAPSTGDEVRVVDSAGRVVGRGVFHATAPMRVRVYSREDEPLDEAFLRGRLERAAAARRSGSGLLDRTNSYRLAHGAGDGLSGLVVDVYAGFAVVQITALAMARRREPLSRCLLELPGIRGVWERASTSHAKLEEFPPGGGRLGGDTPPALVEVVEDGVRYGVDLRGGAKTGHYLDQRDNRHQFALRSTDRTVLDAFSGTGGFGLAALVGGARSVLALDGSGPALATAEANAARNGVQDRLETRRGDAFAALRDLESAGARFGAISVDPPRFARGRRELRGALRGYRELFSRALRMVEPDGVFAATSCTGVVSDADFDRVLRDAAADADVRLQIVRRSAQPADHPFLTSVPEGRYLKHALGYVRR